MAKKQAGSKEGNWFKRHKVLTTLGVVVLLIIFISALSGGDDSDSNTKDTSNNSPQTTTQESKTQAEPEKGFAGGNYKIGTDMPAGEYVIVGSGYLEITSDSTGNFDSLIENDNYTNRTIILVADGQYLQFSGRAYTWEDAPKVDTSGDTLPSGKYKIGVDIPAGEYKLSPTGSGGYVEIASSASGSFDALVSNDNFSSDKYITVSDGQYLSFSRATLKLK